MNTAQRTKGHWPAGKRRNGDGGQWSRIRLQLQRLVDEEHVPTVRSRCVVAAAIGVSDRSVRRWLSGEDVPHEDYQALLRTWCAEQIKRIKSQRRSKT